LAALVPIGRPDPVDCLAPVTRHGVDVCGFFWWLFCVCVCVCVYHK
jgi:hypothetical protein